MVNLGGMLGAIVSGKPDNRGKTQFNIGIIVSALGQSYVYLAYMVFIICLANVNNNFSGISKYIIWFFVFIVTVFPILKIRTAARVEDNESGAYHRNTQVEALDLTMLVSFVAFFIFTFIPKTMSALWSWLPNVH